MKKIIHKSKINSSNKIVYLCNQTFFANPNKSSFRWKNVTCRNCLKQKTDKKRDYRRIFIKAYLRKLPNGRYRKINSHWRKIKLRNSFWDKW